MAKLFAYQIGQNPRIQTDLLVDPQLFEDEHGCMGAVGFGLADCVQTGMFTDIEVIKRYLHEATYVCINGDFDRLSYLEIGIALSLGKTLYVITMNPNVTKEDLGIPFDNATIEFLSPSAFTERIHETEAAEN